MSNNGNHGLSIIGNKYPYLATNSQIWIYECAVYFKLANSNPLPLSMIEIIDALLSLGFSKIDIAMLTLCPLAAVLGSFVNMFIVENDFSQMPPVEKDQYVIEEISKSIFSFRSWLSIFNQKRWYWIWGRVTIGATVGVLVALYFVGAINPGAANAAKVLALSVLAGYMAPKLFVAQDKAISQALEKKLPLLINEAIKREGR